MKLERITLDNFRQYYGAHSLLFAKDDQRNVTLIHGVNGAGKTSLFLALNWCLYGRSIEDVSVISNVGELVSKEAISRAQPFERVRTTVTLVFKHNGQRFRVQRACEGTKQEDGSLQLDNSEEFQMMRGSTDGASQRVANAVGMMNAILPVNVREYFLFDGEKIDNFAKPEAAEQVKQAIYLVLNLEILERAKRHLETAAAEYRRQLRDDAGGELGSLVDVVDKKRDERGRHETRKAEVEASIRSAQTKIADIDQRLRETQHAQNLQMQRDLLERDLHSRAAELDETHARIQDLATGLYAALAMPAVTAALSILDETRARGEIPSNVRQQFVEDLLEQMRCVCGRPINEGTAEHAKLLALLRRSTDPTLENVVVDMAATLRSVGGQVERKQSDLRKLNERKVSLIDLIDELEKGKDDIDRQLKTSPLEEIARLAKNRDDFFNDVGNYRMEIGSLNEKVSVLNKEIQQLDESIEKARKSGARLEIMGAKMALAQKSADAIGCVYESFADEMRKRIESKTREVFQQLSWKGDHFQDVQLDQRFSLEVIDRYGTATRPELSAGERQVLSLSFIAAMAQVSGQEAPLVMDTPFGRLSSQHRDSITQRLPELASQLILLVTDEEMSEQARRNLEPYIGSEYTLRFDPSTSQTTVEER
ncbi:ABC transporter ATP-binding protein [Deinococcus indicus]|uniref:AAA family ATPase n=1 Tax=Deinococcus indicus TaxID=223556 RepID=UPI00174B3125|nr:AAA family ATPase [Deinococcus indicus]GHG32641.1 ABC transporter ATP-binding protein [Deinococcus indicus]